MITSLEEIAPRCPITGLPGVTGRELRRLMRVHRVTIRELARRMGLSMKAIRRQREKGASFLTSLDLWQAIANCHQLDARHSAQLRQWRSRPELGDVFVPFDAFD